MESDSNCCHGKCRTDDRKIRLVCRSFFPFVKVFLTFGPFFTGRPGSASPQTCLCNSTAAVLTRGEVRKHLERQTQGKRVRPCSDETLRGLPVRANVPLSYNWLCCCARVRVSVHGSLTTAACHYRPWLLFTGASWPVEVHLGGCSHLSGPGQGLKLIYRPLIWCLVLIVPGRLLISKLYNVFTLVNQPIRMFWPPLKKSYILAERQHVIPQSHLLEHDTVCVCVCVSSWVIADKHHCVLSTPLTVMVFEHGWFQGQSVKFITAFLHSDQHAKIWKQNKCSCYLHMV